MTCTELEKAPRPKRNGLPFDGCIRSEVAIVLGMEVEMVDTSEILLEPARLEPLPFVHGRRWLLLFVVVAIFAISVVVALVSCKGISSTTTLSRGVAHKQRGITTDLVCGDYMRGTTEEPRL